MSEADIAREVAMQMEVRKDGLKQVQSGDVKLTLTVNQLDMPNELYGDPMGQRYVCVLVRVDDNEEPVAAPKKGKNYTAAAKLLCKNDSFCAYMSCNTAEEAEIGIENHCGVTSCSEIKDGTEAGNKFARLQANYYAWMEGR